MQWMLPQAVKTTKRRIQMKNQRTASQMTEMNQEFANTSFMDAVRLN